ncbi:MAG: hypothetical protein JW818_18070 [Pirellulales bacterium]|nr:hypothetical protein [Pirellulales bacterium]
MFGRILTRWLSRWIWGVAVLACLCMSGCARLDLRGPGFARDDAFDWSGSVRRPDEQVEFFGFSNKAREIESHVVGH